MAEEGTRGDRIRKITVRTLAVIGGLVVIGSVFVLILILVAVRPEPVPRQTILELNLEAGLVEHIPDDPLTGLTARRQMVVRDVVEALHRAAADDRVVALVARTAGGALGFGQVEEVREAVLAFRQSGKPAILFSETFGEFAPGQSGYYLATAFDEIYMQPSGDVGLTGLISEQPFLAGTLERLDVEPRLDRRHEYKTAANLFTEAEFTEPHREATASVVNSIFSHMVGAIAEARGLTPERVREIIDSGPLYGAEAVEAGLVDRLAYRDEVYDSLQARVGERAEFLFLRRYLDRAGRFYTRGETVALIYGVGAVTRGESRFHPMTGGASMGAETVTRAFRDAIEDDRVRAILFRVDSPGGSYVASDAIWREVVRARAAGKPVVVSMGNVAGSGGYFVAMAADRIIAHPSTITGSIGVVGGKAVTRELWNQLGVTWDTVQAGGNATMWSGIYDYTPEEWERVQAGLDRVYADFTAKVAQGRDMTPEQVDAIARGRIWSGSDALRLGLVDDLGGFTTALHQVREVAGLEPDAEIRLRVFPERRPLLQQLLEPGPDSSYPTGLAALVAPIVEVVQPLYLLARRVGLMGEPGVLMMPEVPLR